MTFQEAMFETNDKDKYLLSKIYDIFDKSKKDTNNIFHIIFQMIWKSLEKFRKVKTPT